MELSICQSVCIGGGWPFVMPVTWSKTVRAFAIYGKKIEKVYFRTKNKKQPKRVRSLLKNRSKDELITAKSQK